ncbi:hypothetical protein Cs7R123_25420 [Catellatospora sp. TT07R-123]|uniref:hypothetical protein n=1 Tax=Catellatospora sp. TT07R-123 TaxID=2733863 RepID=UPI001B2D4050|nr:hypothetical protein [Catellatospora sp. TT07R-123]GHJ45200.1 hypothetical protein Cs7R123_25420 [Catellatospora sp. TT07R-123]
MAFGSSQHILPVTGVSMLLAPGVVLKVISAALSAVLVGVVLLRMYSQRERAVITARPPARHRAVGRARVRPDGRGPGARW